MSGGQRQRVAIGRALVKEPKLFLLDEPLSNLDAALRLRTRVELAQLKQKVDAAVIMVTHDQAEAMTLADRIVVMNDRRIQQVGAPMEIYSRPANTFVAQFVGSPAMTLLPAQLVDGRRVRDAEARRRHGGRRRSVPRDGAARRASFGSAFGPKRCASAAAARARPRRRSSWSSGSASARSSTRGWPTARRSPPRTRATAALKIGDEVAARRSTARAAHVFGPRRHRLSPGRRMTSERDWRGLLFVAPFLLLYSLILVFPLLRGLWLSLNQVDLFGAGHFVGVGNYVAAGCTIRSSAPRWSTRSR